MEAIIVWLSKHTLVLFAMLILLANFIWLLKFQKKLNLLWKEALLVAAVHVIVGWSCMRLLAIIEVGGDLEKAAKIRLFGAIFVLPFLYFAWGKLTGRKTELIMDIAAVCVIFGAISGRLNCFTNGCCNGVPIFFAENLKWPIRELEMIYYFVFLMYYCKRIVRGKTYGQVYPVYLISYGIIRLACEFVREEFTTNVGVLHLAHIWSIISIAAGMIWYYRIIKSKNTSKSKNSKKAKK